MNSSERSFFLCANGDLRAELSRIGAGLRQLYFKGIPLLECGEGDSFFEPNPFYNGQTIAPFAGRIPDGKIGPFRFETNEGTNCLHGGFFAASYKPFECEISENEREIAAIFSYFQKVEGVELTTKTTYCFAKDTPRFLLKVAVTSSAPFPLNPTHHIYWNLGAKSLEEFELRMRSHRRPSYDGHKRPGSIVDCTEEFHGERLLLNDKTDYAYLLDEPILSLRRGNLRLKARTDGKAVVIFTGFSPSRACVTLEFVNAVRNDESILIQGTASVQTEYELEEL